MYSFKSVFLGVSSVSALVLVPDVPLIAPSPTSLDTVSSTPEMAEGPWNVSTMLKTPPISLNMTHPSTSSVTHQYEWRCSSTLGHGPYAASCEDAVRHMAFVPSGTQESQEISWGFRDTPAVWDVGLPQEVVSSDGRCGINLHLASGSHNDIARASQSQVKAGVAVVIENCVKNRARPVGGAVQQIDNDGLLAAWVWVVPGGQDFTGTCYGGMQARAEASCKWILDRMAAESDDGQVFGPRNDAEANVHLPWRRVSPDHRCALTVKTAGPSDTTSWVILWEVAVQLAGICARHGMQGREVQLGEDRNLALFLTDPALDDINDS